MILQGVGGVGDEAGEMDSGQILDLLPEAM